MRVYTHRVSVKAPLGDVAEFHRDAQALRRLTMPPVFIQIHSAEPLAENSKTEFTLWLGPLPMQWLAVHSQVDQLYGFTDTQSRGPFMHWEHQHRFIKIDEYTTEITDEIQAQMPRHLFWKLVCWLMWVNLPLMFAYRSWVIRRAMEQKR
jgi:ligand-binding SRPBCC domain-containing protein